MPSLLMFPFIQCHHASGRALCGGFTKPAFKVSSGACEGFAALCAKSARPDKVSNVMPTATFPTITDRMVLFFVVICDSYQKASMLLLWSRREYISEASSSSISDALTISIHAL